MTREEQEEANRIAVRNQKTQYAQNYFSPMFDRISRGFSNIINPLVAGFNPTFGGGYTAAYKAEQAGLNAMREAAKGNKTSDQPVQQEVSAGTNAAQNVQNGAGTISTNTDGGQQAIVAQVPGSGSIISLTPGRSMSLTAPDMQSDIDKQKSQMQSMFTQSDNKIRGSKSRMGLFGNYGKDVEIRKTYDPETGKITRSKFVDGEQVKKGQGFQGVRRAKRAGNFGKIQDKVTGVFDKSRENREKRQQTRSNRRKNKSTGGLF